jgi:hypothetical protein
MESYRNGLDVSLTFLYSVEKPTFQAMRRDRFGSGAARQLSPGHTGRRIASTMPKRHSTVCLVLALIVSMPAFAGCRGHEITSTTGSTSFDATGMDSVEIMDSLKRGPVASAELIDIYSDRIARFDKVGPKLNSIIAINPRARALADVLDCERAPGKVWCARHEALFV